MAELELTSDQQIEREKDALLLAIIKKLPDGEVPLNLQDRHHCKELGHHREFWIKVGQRIDYLQKIQVGIVPDPSEDPCQNPGANPVAAEWLKVFADYHFHILRVLIGNPTESVNGFSMIRSWAKSQGREFNFREPRQLFAQICIDQANGGLRAVLEPPSEEEGRPTKEGLKQVLRQRKKLFRFSLDDGNEKQQLIDSWGADDWSVAWIAGIFAYESELKRPKNPLNHYWIELNKAHDRLVAFICCPATEHAKHDAKIILPGRDRANRAIDPETKQRLFA